MIYLVCVQYIKPRGGTRGGQAEFTWDQVRGDQHRENYLGHSIFAPTGRWQNNKDVNWYNKDNNPQDDDQTTSKDLTIEKRRQELMELKLREEEEMNKRLGIKSGQSSCNGGGGSSSRVGDTLLQGSSHNVISSRAAPGTGSNRAPLDASKSKWNPSSIKSDSDSKELQELESGLSKEDRRAARHLAKMQVREERRLRRENRQDRPHHHHKSRSSDEDESHRDSHPEDRQRRSDKDRYRESRQEVDRDRDRRSDRQETSIRPRQRDDIDHRDRRQYRSRSPGRSITPEMQRRRRE